MGKKLRNRIKKQVQEQNHVPVLHLKRRYNFDPQFSSNPARDDQIQEKSGDDFIDRLPDDMLQHIISLLPPTDAVRTSFLSTRWRDLLKAALDQIETPEKDGNVDGIFCKIADFVDDSRELSVLTSGEDSEEYRSVLGLKKYCRRLRYNFGHSGFLLATIASNGTLQLDFHYKKNEIPCDFDLRWTATHDSMWLWFDDPFISPVSPYKFIRTLYLIAVTNLTSHAVSSMLSEFRDLKSLIIKDCHGLHSLRIVARSSLSKLMIFNCLQLKSLHIKSDRIDKFLFRGLLPGFTCEYSGFIHACRLVDAMLDFRGGPGYDHFTHQHSDSLLSAIESSRILTLCRWTFELAMIRWKPRLIWLRPRANKYPHLKELQWIDNEVGEHSIDALISFLQKCPSLQKLYINIDPTSYSRTRTRKHRDQDFECERLVYLEAVQIEGVMKECDKKLLASRLLDVVTKKTKIIAKSHDNRVWRLEEVSLFFPTSEIWYPLLQEGMKHYMFVEVNEEESGKLCSKHAHADL